MWNNVSGIIDVVIFEGKQDPHLLYCINHSHMCDYNDPEIKFLLINLLLINAKDTTSKTGSDSSHMYLLSSKLSF